MGSQLGIFRDYDWTAEELTHRITAATLSSVAVTLGQGVPLALDEYATKASYAPYLGAGATERFGLPYRSFFLRYSLQVR